MDIKQLKLVRDWLGELTSEDTNRIIEEKGLTIDSRETDYALYCLYSEILTRIRKEEEAVG